MIRAVKYNNENPRLMFVEGTIRTLYKSQKTIFLLKWCKNYSSVGRTTMLLLYYVIYEGRYLSHCLKF